MKEHNIFKDKTILVTGGTGTFGRTFVSKLLAMPEVRRVNVLSRDEYKQSQMRQEYNDPRLGFFLGDVRDSKRLGRAFLNADIVVHAAALKQVPALEYDPLEAIQTNIKGTQNVIDAALDNNVERVLFVSSDKAVQPINLYGATKLCAERVVVSSNAYRGTAKQTRFSVVRYGNVVGSRGSIVELIEKQRQSGVVHLTDERMTRFWIPVDAVMEIIFEALAFMEGGEIFVPKMESLKISDILEAIAPEAKIKVVGIRPGEKLHEVLITEYEAPRAKDAGNMFVILPEFVSWEQQGVFKDKPDYPDGLIYQSNSPDFLRDKENVRRILRV